MDSEKHITIYNQGMQLKKQQLFKEAIDCFNHVIKLKPDWMFPYYMKGLCYLDLKEWEHSMDAFFKVIGFDPEEGDAFANIGWALSELNRWSEAIEYFEKSLQIGLKDNQVYVIYSELGKCYKNLAIHSLNEEEKNKYANLGITNGFGKAIEINPNVAVLWVEMGLLSLILKNYASAIDCFQSIYDHDPKIQYHDSKRAALGLITAHIYLQNWDTAFEILKKLLKNNPDLKPVIDIDPISDWFKNGPLASDFEKLMSNPKEKKSSLKGLAKEAMDLLLADINKYNIWRTQNATKKIKLNKYTFSNLDLKNALLVNMDLSNCVFENCNLNNTSFWKSILSESNFSNCDGSVLFGPSEFNNMNLMETPLWKVLPYAAEMKSIQFIDCNFQNSMFRDAFMNGSKFINCNLKNSNFYNVGEENIEFENSNIENCKFGGMFF